GGKVDPFPLDRLDDEGREVTLPKLALQRLQIVERDRAAFRQKGAEALAEDAVAIQRQRSIGQAVEAMLAVEYAGAAGRGARELDRRFHRFRAGVAAEQIVHAGKARQQALGEEPGENGDVQLDEVRQPGVENIVERLDDRRMVASESEHAEAAEQVQIAMADLVVHVLPLGPHVYQVVAHRSRNTNPLRL